MVAARRVEPGGQIGGDVADAARAVHQLQHLDRVFIRHEKPFRPQQHPGAAGLVEAEFHADAEARNDGVVDMRRHGGSAGSNKNIRRRSLPPRDGSVATGAYRAPP